MNEPDTSGLSEKDAEELRELIAKVPSQPNDHFATPSHLLSELRKRKAQREAGSN